MPKRPFSKKYKTFEEWLANFKGSESYRNRIIRAHTKYPNATLSPLRGHARKKEKKVSELKENQFTNNYEIFCPKNIRIKEKRH